MKTKIAYVAASIAALTVPLACFSLPMAGCSSGTSTAGNNPDSSTTSTTTGTTTTTSTTSGTTTGSTDANPGTDAKASPLCTGCTLVPLTAIADGYVSPSVPAQDDGGLPPNSVGVTGSWYAYGDGWGTEAYMGMTGVAGERGNCELLGGFAPADCSQITSPLPPAPAVDAGPEAGIPEAGAGYANGFPSSASQTFCLSGTAAAVLTKDGGTSPDYSDIFGIGLGFDFNNIGGNKMPYSATGNKVVGVQFEVTSSGIFPTLRVEFPTQETGGDGGNMDSYDIAPTAAGVYQVYFATFAGGPRYAAPDADLSYMVGDGASQPAFDATKLLSIQFHVPTNVTSAIPVKDLCVANLSAIVSK